MESVSTFLTAMAALSAATQTFVEHVIKKNWGWLDQAKKGSEDNKRQVAIHLTVFGVGAALAWSVQLTPLTYLGLGGNPVGNAAAAGVLVSFGGSFFDEALGAIREFKKAQESARTGGE